MESEEINERRDTLALLDVVISSLAGSADLEELEAECLRAICTLTPSHATALYVMKPATIKPMRIAASGVDDDFLAYYENRGREVDPLRRWITTNRRPNQSQLLLGLRGWQHHPVYRIVDTAEIDFAMQSPILSGQEIIGTLNFGRHLSEGAYSEADLRAIAIISHFLGLAMTKMLNRSAVNEQQSRFCRALNKFTQGVVITDYSDAVRYSNSAARQISGRALGADQPIEELPRLICRDERGEFIPTGALRPALTVRRCTIPGARLSHKLILLDDEAPADFFRHLQGLLTPREIDVLRQVEKGLQNREIAAALCISINTVKRHLDNIYAKLDVKSRAELIARVYRGTIPSVAK